MRWPGRTAIRLYGLVAILVLLVGLIVFRPYINPLINPAVQLMFGKKSTAGRLAEFGDAARSRMRPAFDTAGVAYPPGAVTLVAVKMRRTLTVYAGPSAGALKPVVTYPVLGQSGELGPKLREGDRQVPEGLYRIEGLNPNSSFHVSLRVNYPNAFDLEQAAADGRENPGSDIFIHGQRASIGCLAMGNPAIEELFTLAADVGLNHIQLIITPVDFREPGAEVSLPDAPEWASALYAQIEDALKALHAQ